VTLSDESDGNRRLDKWLWCARFFKTRSLAAAAIGGGKVHVNGERVKPSRRLGVGDRITVSQQGIVAEFDVRGMPVRRGPAAEASAHYEETAASRARRAVLKEQQRLADQSRPRPDTRPDKRERRRLMKLQRGQA